MPTNEPYHIREYFQNLSGGDADAFAAIFEMYKKRVFSVAFKVLKSETEAEEIVQDVFMSVWTAKANLNNVNDPEAYLFTIVYNKIYSHLKKVSRDQRLLDAMAHRINLMQSTTDETIAAHETGKLINEAVQKLPAQQRAVYEFSKQDGLTYDEIAEYMHISRNTVRNHLSEAMKTIRIFLKNAAMFFILLIKVFLG